MTHYAACPTCHAPMRVDQLSNGKGLTWAGFHCGASQQFEDDEVFVTSNEVTKRAGNVVPKSGAPGKALLKEKDIPMKATSKTATALMLANIGSKAKKSAKKAAKADGKTNGKAKAAKADGKGKPKQKKAVAKVLTPTWKKIFGELGKVEFLTRADLTKVAEKHGAKGWYGRFVRGGLVARESGKYRLTTAGKKAVAAKA